MTLNTNVFPVDLGEMPNDGTGDPLRVAFAKINDNFEYLSNLAPNGPEGAVQFIRDGVSAGDSNLIFNEADGNLETGLNVIPLTDLGSDIGATDRRFGNLFVGGASIGNVTISEEGNVLSFSLGGGATSDIEVNSIVASGSFVLDNEEHSTFEVTTTTNAANQIVFERSVMEFDNGRFVISSRETTSHNAQKVTIDVVKNTTNLSANFVAHSTVFVGTPLTRYNVDVSFGNVRVMVSPFLNTEIVHSVSYTVNS